MKLETRTPPHVWVCGRWRRYNIEDPAITQLSPARRQRSQELGNLSINLKFFSFKRLAIVSCHFLYSYLIVEKYDTMIFLGSQTKFSVALFCHVGEA